MARNTMSSSTIGLDQDVKLPKTKRITACLHCRRQKLKCDVGTSDPCSRCKNEGVECVVRPRANAAILTDDLRWQQSVETRFQSINNELQSLRAALAQSSSISHAPPKATVLPDDIFQFTPNSVQSTAGPSAPPLNTAGPSYVLPEHLRSLRDALRQPLQTLQSSNSAAQVSADEAAILWEAFYTQLAIYHGFVAGMTVTTPSPLLLASIAAAATSRSADPNIRGRHSIWLDFFNKAVTESIADSNFKTWDDPVALCIARTWFWISDSTTTGLIYGSFMNTLSPATADMRSRRVWDFIQITITSCDVFRLGHCILPDRAPELVPARQYPHVLFGALTELFDLLGNLPRLMPSRPGLVEMICKQSDSTGTARRSQNWSYAETSLLRTCVSDIHNWGAKWSTAIHATQEDALPGGRSKSFLLDLINVYYQAAMVIVNGYLQQGSDHDLTPYHEAARNLLLSILDVWSESVSFLPCILINSALLAALALDQHDPLANRAYTLLEPLASIFDRSGHQLLQSLQARYKTSPTFLDTVLPAMPIPDANLLAHTGSDAFWDDILGSLQVDNIGPDELNPNASVQTQGVIHRFL